MKNNEEIQELKTNQELTERQKRIKLEIEETAHCIKHGDVVRFLSDWTERHRGQVVGLTTTFAKVYRPKKNEEDTGGDVSPDSAEWLPISHSTGGIIKMNVNED